MFGSTFKLKIKVEDYYLNKRRLISEDGKQLIAEETTKSGIVLPGQAKEKPQQAEVVAVGPGGVVEGKEVTMQVKVGDKVIFSKYSGTEVEMDEEKFVIVKQNDILAVIE